MIRKQKKVEETLRQKRLRVMKEKHAAKQQEVAAYYQGSGKVDKRTAKAGELQEDYQDILTNDTSGFDWNPILKKARLAIKGTPKRALSEVDRLLYGGVSYFAYRDLREEQFKARHGREEGPAPEYNTNSLLEQYRKQEHQVALAKWKAEYNKRINAQEKADIAKQNAAQAKAEAERKALNIKRFEMLKIGAGLATRSGEEFSTSSYSGTVRKRRGISGLTVGLEGAGLGIPGV
jgi:hypothetical protein